MKKIKLISSIRFRVILFTMVIITIPMITLATVQIYESKQGSLKSILKSSKKYVVVLDNMITNHIMNIEDNMTYIEGKIHSFKLNLDNDVNEFYKDKLELSMQELIKNSDNIERMYLILENGEIYRGDRTTLPEKYEPRSRPFYKEARNNKGKIAISNLYEWNGEYVLTISKAIIYDGDIIGVLGVDINIEGISSLIKDAKIHEDGDIILLDNDRVIVSNSASKSLKGYKIDEIADRFNAKDDIKHAVHINNLEIISLQGESYIANTTQSQLPGWKIVHLIKDEYVLNKLYDITSKIVFMTFMIMFFAAIFIIVLSKKTWLPMEYILDMIKNVQDGNYNIKKRYNKDNEFGLIEDSLYHMSNEIKEVHKALEVLAYNDLLLEIKNKNSFYNRIYSILSKKNNSGFVAIIDINNFKFFNERFDYTKGDIFLKEIVLYLLTIVEYDNLFRCGDDEFVIVLENFDKDRIKDLVEKIHIRFEDSWYINDINYKSKVTIGITEYNSNEGHNIDFILKRLAYALKEAKSQKIGTSYYEAHNDRIKRRNSIVEILDKSIEKNKLKIYYHPIRDIESNIYTKMEALIRLVDDDVGIISPVEFISIAEESGQIYDIGMFVIESACRKILDLDSKNIKLEAISVNISVIQLMNENFVDDVINIIDKYKIGYDRLVFEITESIFMHSYEKALYVMEKLSEKGLRFALDDFGTGFSSLSYILNLDIDILKIDKSFIENISTSSKSREMVEAIIIMGEKLGLQIILEGVETDDQLKVLRDLGCKYIQGYYFSKPVADDEINDILI